MYVFVNIITILLFFRFNNSLSISYMVDLVVMNYHSLCLTVKDDFLFEGQLWHILASKLAV